jgi:Arc/MetJ-type ribon-helix-helix transcriptional regulator
MATINVSIPDKLKQQAEALIDAGYYASFSDVVRDSIRQTIEKNMYDLLADQAKIEYSEGKTISLNTQEDINKFVDKIDSNARARAKNPRIKAKI